MRNAGWWTALCCTLCGLMLSPVAAQEEGGSSAKAWVDSTQYAVGDRIAVHIELDHPAGISFQPLVADTVGGFYVIARTPLEAQGQNKTVTTLVVARYDSGTATLPPLAFLSSAPGDSASRVVATNALQVTVHTVSVDTTQEIKDLKPPLRVAWTLAEILTVLGILVVLAGLGYLGYRFWKRKGTVQAGPSSLPPPRPAHLLALEELAALRERKLWQQGLIKEYYSEVTEILRRYLERRYGVMALEQTTDEILESLRARQSALEVAGSLEMMLRRADLVKFARYQPGIAEHEEMLTGAVAMVEKTKPVPVAPEGKAGSHVGA